MGNATNRLVWAAMVVSLLVYAGVAYVAAGAGIGDPSSHPALLTAIFAGLSVAVAVGTLHYRRRALVEPLRSGQIDLGTEAGRQRAFQPFVVTLALSESVGLFGLVLAFLSGRAEYTLPFLCGALALMVRHRPTHPELNPTSPEPGAPPSPPPIG